MGSTGSLGKSLTLQLKLRGATVVSVVRDARGNQDSVAKQSASSDLTLSQFMLLLKTDTAFKKSLDFVFYCAVEYSPANEHNFELVNRRIPLALAQLLKESEAQLVLFGSYLSKSRGWASQRAEYLEQKKRTLADSVSINPKTISFQLEHLFGESDRDTKFFKKVIAHCKKAASSDLEPAERLRIVSPLDRLDFVPTETQAKFLAIYASSEFLRGSIEQLFDGSREVNVGTSMATEVATFIGQACDFYNVEQSIFIFEDSNRGITSRAEHSFANLTEEIPNEPFQIELARYLRAQA